MSKLSVVMNVKKKGKLRALDLVLCRCNLALDRIRVGGSLRVASPISRVAVQVPRRDKGFTLVGDGGRDGFRSKRRLTISVFILKWIRGIDVQGGRERGGRRLPLFRP